MRNGRPTLRKLGAEMMQRFDLLERNFTSQLIEMERSLTARLLQMKRTFSKDIRGLKTTIGYVIDELAELDDEVKKHARDPRAHQ